MKHSRFERERRTQETERIKQIESAWYASIPRDAAVAFAQDVERARARGPIPPPPNMAPGTAPNPPRPGREPKPPKDAQRTSRR